MDVPVALIGLFGFVVLYDVAFADEEGVFELISVLR